MPKLYETGAQCVGNKFFATGTTVNCFETGGTPAGNPAAGFIYVRRAVFLRKQEAVLGLGPKRIFHVVHGEIAEAVLMPAFGRARLVGEGAVLVGEVLADRRRVDDKRVAVLERGRLAGRIDLFHLVAAGGRRVDVVIGA